MRGKNKYEGGHKVRSCGLQRGEDDTKKEITEYREVKKLMATLTKSVKDARVVWEIDKIL